MSKEFTNKRWIVIISIVMVMVIATAGIAVSGFKGHFNCYGKDVVKEHMLSRIDYTMQELKLSPGQQAEYAAIRDRISVEMDAFSKRHDAVRSVVHNEMSKAAPDIKTIAGTLKKEVSSMPDRLNAQIDALVDVYGILNAEQQKRLIAMLKEHMADRDCD